MNAERPTGPSKGESWALSPDSRRPLPELIEERLRELIEEGTLSPGDRLPTEPELAADMQVARSSLRTALQRLQIRGIVEVVRGRGWYVRSANTAVDEAPPSWVIDRRFSDSDLLEVRIALETTAASLATLRASAGELDDLAKLSEAHKAASSTDRDELLATDEAFHEAVVKASHNHFLEHLYQTLVPLLRPHRIHSYTSREVHFRSANDHNQLVMFLRRRDEVAARTAMTTHLLGLYDDLAAAGQVAEAEIATLTTYVGVDDEPIWNKDK